ncbi:MAG: insulinase family protein [Clostridiales bacterium]|nr:insulinase family protein [Clostridiales bacterium]
MYKLYTLKNGLKVVTEKNEWVNSVSVGIMIKNGSRNESEELNGISHFIEHMMFKGTEKRSSKEIAEVIENVGGQINAYTSKEVTCYYTKTLYTHLDLSLEVLSDMMFNSTFSEEELEKEKKVVIEEINMSDDTPEDVLYDLNSKVSYGDHSLGAPILGTIEKVSSFTREELKKYISEKYTPYNSVISVCGKFDENELEELVNKYFSNWNCNEKYSPKYEKVEIIPDSGVVEKNIEQLHISLGLKGLPSEDERTYSLALLCNILGGGASSILFQKVREELGLCYTIYCYPQNFEGSGLINIYAGLGKNYGEEALQVISREVKKFSKNKISEEELKMAKEKIKGSYILGRESTSSKMFSNAKTILFRNKIYREKEVIDKINNITLDEINIVLEETFGKGIINSSYVGKNINYEKLNSVLF